MQNYVFLAIKFTTIFMNILLFLQTNESNIMFDAIFSEDKIIQLTKVKSTNEFAVDFLKNNNTDEGIIIWGISQTNGKGQKGNRWESEDGQNLTFSIILHPKMIEPSMQFLLNKAISLGIIDFLASKIDKSKLKIKWPNDIYFDKLKIAGILIENEVLGAELQTSIVGIGLNLNQIKFSANIPNPTSLRLISGKEQDTRLMLLELLSALESRILKLYNNDIELNNNDYLNNLLYYNIYKKYIWQNTEITAKIINITEYGQLILKTNDNKTLICN